MLKRLHEIIGYTIRGTDAQIGEVEDLYFDDHSWVVRYVVVDTGRWLPGRLVLVSPQDAGTPDDDRRVLPVSLTAEKIENAPGHEQDVPVSRRHEMELAQYYGWVPYWEPIAAPLGGSLATPMRVEGETEEAQSRGKGDPHLRSIREVTGYHIQASDGGIGHVEDFLAEPEDWAIRYMLVDTRNWLPGRKVLVAPDWIQSILWDERRVHVNLAREKIRSSPEFDPDHPPTGAYERRLHQHYDKPPYWGGSEPDGQ